VGQYAAFITEIYLGADPSGRAVQGIGLQPLVCRDCRFESRGGHGCLSVVSIGTHLHYSVCRALDIETTEKCCARSHTHTHTHTNALASMWTWRCNSIMGSMVTQKERIYDSQL